ncbi:MAG: polymerase Rpb6 [Acidobacteriota bacterium]|nr:polymerase Rpb6 [Acidobacteriota bacterium]
MAKQTKAATSATVEAAPREDKPFIDSKYRMIIVAAQRSKQLQRGARPRVDMDTQRHKSTRVAIEEVQQGKVNFDLIERE